MKPSEQDLDGRLALLVEWRDAERRLDLMEARPSRVNPAGDAHLEGDLQPDGEDVRAGSDWDVPELVDGADREPGAQGAVG